MVVLRVVYPSCADLYGCQYALVGTSEESWLTWQLVIVLVELVAELVGSDQHTGFGVT
jgi:hypothetical protein